MKIPAGCILTLESETEGGVTTMVMNGEFRLSTGADVAMMVEAMTAIGEVLAPKPPRKRKKSTGVNTKLQVA